jgi:dTDP-4-amino-4,6-dideoxygalactose transaminase
VLRKITPRTRAILPVHFAGRLCDMDALTRIAGDHGLVLLEDCAHAIETTGIDGRHAGAYGELGAFSFYATKNITTAEGGMVVTRSRRIADRLRVLALHGMSKDAWHRFSDKGYKHYDIVELGYKCNMTDIQASLGLSQLARVEWNLRKRQEIWKRYDEAFADLPLELPAPVPQGTRHARHLYTVLVDGVDGLCRDTVLAALHAEGIGAGVHYLPLNGYTYYQNELGVKPGDFPHAEEIGSRTVSLPLSPSMTDDDVEDVVEAVRRILEWPAW